MQCASSAAACGAHPGLGDAGLEGRAPRSESFFPTLPVLGSLMEGAATSLGSLFGRGASQSSDSDPPEAPGLWKAPASRSARPWLTLSKQGCIAVLRSRALRPQPSMPGFMCIPVMLK